MSLYIYLGFHRSPHAGPFIIRPNCRIGANDGLSLSLCVLTDITYQSFIIGARDPVAVPGEHTVCLLSSPSETALIILMS